MQNRKIKIAIISAIALCLCYGYALAYTVDGNVTDWGINLSASNATRRGYLDNNLPTGGNDIDNITEDNGGKKDEAGSYIYGYQFLGPGYSYGNSNSSTRWYRKGNSFDAEAMYFDNDPTNAYLALITGLPITGFDAPGSPWFYPGDIGFDFNNDNVYEYAIDVRSYNATTNQAKLYSGLTNLNWTNVTYSQYAAANPWEVKNGNSTYSYEWIDFVYSPAQNTHYVMEAGIPLEYFGLDESSNQNLTIHWTMQCGNDVLNLKADVNNSVPEPASMVLLGMGLLGLAGLGKKKKIKDLI